MISDDSKRAIGKIVAVSSDRFTAELFGRTDNFTVSGFDDIHYVASLGAFVLIPAQAEYVVAEIIGLREKDANSGKDSESNLDLDKAYSAKFLDIVPVGMLPLNCDKDGEFRFGISVYPDLYADILYIKDSELDKIFGVDKSEKRIPQTGGKTRYNSVSIGTSAVFQGYDVKIRLNEFFGGHSAILGNTGSGKSCTVASVLQSVFEKKTEYKARGATFIIFDVNGEYQRAFAKLEDRADIHVSNLAINGKDDDGNFHLPHWFLNLEEWELLLQASEKTQLPILRTALGLTSMLKGEGIDENIKTSILAQCILGIMCGNDGIVNKIQRVRALLKEYHTEKLNSDTLKQCDGHKLSYSKFERQDEFMEHIAKLIETDIDMPSYDNKSFNFSDLEKCLDLAILYEEAYGNRQIRDYCASMITRLKNLSAREEFAFLKDVNFPIDKNDFLEQILGIKDRKSPPKQDQIIIINLNNADDEVVELVSAVIARMVFDLLRHAEPRNKFPVHFVLEEAHRYISEKPSRYAIDAGRIFERIAKEGRKYGAFLIAASQRPSELSRTVLSQCSNFVVHRIQNPEDLKHIRLMTPFISDAVLNKLPSLPKQHALIFGNAVNIPAVFKVRKANPLPAGEDTDISGLWFQGKGWTKKLPD